MITEIELENYRGFSKHKIPLRPVSIIVGRNNSGKSTIIEALKKVHDEQDFKKYFTFIQALIAYHKFHSVESKSSEKYHEWGENWTFEQVRGQFWHRC